MKFKNSFHVVVDNFPVTYKHLLYQLVVALITVGLYAAVILPFIKGLTGSQPFTDLINGAKDFFNNLVEGRPEQLGESTERIKAAFTDLITMIAENRGNIALGFFGLFVVHFIATFAKGLGNYALAAIINDKMAMGAVSPYVITLVRNLKSAALYSIIYTPISIVYDMIFYTGLFFLIFHTIPFLPFQIFLYSTLIVVAISFKMVLTTDWLPALIRGKMSQKQAFLYTFDRRGKQTFNVLANFAVLIVLIYAVNVGAIICTFGTAGLISIPASYLVLISFEMVNYYDRENCKYFIDKNTIIEPHKGRNLTREEFFRGESD